MSGCHAGVLLLGSEVMRVPALYPYVLFLQKICNSSGAHHSYLKKQGLSFPIFLPLEESLQPSCLLKCSYTLAALHNYVLNVMLLLLPQQLMGISRHLSLPFFSRLMSPRQRNSAQLKSDASHQLARSVP